MNSRLVLAALAAAAFAAFTLWPESAAAEDSIALAATPPALDRTPIPVKVEAGATKFGPADGVRVHVEGAAQPAAAVVVFVDNPSRDTANQPLDLDALFTARGQRFTCDAEGTARVPRVERDGLVACWQDGRFGVAAVTPAAKEVRLVLQPDQLVRVVVVDASGREAAGVPVALRLALGPTHLDVLRRTTGADGTATLRHLHQYLVAGDSAAAQTYSVALSLPLSQPVGVPIDPLRPPEDLVRLRLPATGVIDVTLLDTDGRVCRKSATVELQAVAVAPGQVDELAAGARTFRVPVRGGRVEIPHVGIGLQLVVTARIAGRPRASSRYAGFGPRRAGERKRVTLRFKAADVTYEGRILDARGEPVVQETLRYRFRSPKAHNATIDAGSVATDAYGRFRITLPGGGRRFAQVLDLESGDAAVAITLDEGARAARVDLGSRRLR